MPISYRVGQVGSGKSLEMLEIDMLPGLREARLVLYNIEGVNKQLVSDYIGKNCEADMEYYTLEELRDPKFYYHPTDNPTGRTRPGCILIVDEAREAFPAKPASPDEHVSREALVFFRKHRHYTDDQGRPIDIVLATQLYTDVHPSIRNLATKTIETRKMGMFGLGNRYRIRVYEGLQNPTTKSNVPTSVKFRKYNKDIFPLYQSAQTSVINATNVGHSTNLLQSKLFRFVLPLVVIAMVYGGYSLYQLFHPAPVKSKPAPALHNPPGTPPFLPSGSSPASASPGAPVSGAEDNVSPYQLVGDYYAYNGLRVFVLNREGKRSYHTLNDFRSVKEVGPYLNITELNGRVISDVYRPAPAPAQQQPQGASNVTSSSTPGR